MGAILQPQPAGSREAQVGLVHEGGGVEQRVPSAGAEPCTGHAVQLGVHRREQQIGGFGVAAIGAVNQLGHAGGVNHAGPFIVQHASSGAPPW